MSTQPITFDMSTAKPLAGDQPSSPEFPPAAAALQGAVSYAAQQNSDHYAKLLKFQQLTGVPPVVSKGNEQQVQQAADANRLDPRYLTTIAPNVSAWASNPDNAAVSGVDGIQNLAGIEQNAAGMRELPSVRAYTPTLWEKAYSGLNDAYRFATQNPTNDLKKTAYGFPLTRWGADIVGGTAGIAGNIGALFGWQGNGPTKENLLQRINTALKPENALNPETGATSNPMDWLAGQGGPLIASAIASGGTSILAEMAGWSPTAAKVAAGLSVGAMFTADQSGQTYTSQLAAGASPDDARLAANRVALINALPNSLFGATDVVPLLRDNPLLTSLGLGAATGASGRVAENVVTGQPWAKGVPAAMVQGAAMQGGMHVGFGALGGEDGAGAVAAPRPGSYVDHLASAVGATEQSELRGRSPEKFYEAAQGIFAGDASLRIPAEKFAAYFTGKGLDPAEIAKGLGAPNYAEAVLSGGDVEIPPADFLAKLDSEHQKALLPDVVDPATELTTRQHQDGRDELAQWVTGGGVDKLVAETAAADAETAASPEFQAVKETLRQKYEAAGETPEVAETLADKDASVYSNLARNAGMKPSELLGLYNPKVVRGEAPEGEPVAPRPNEDAAKPIVFEAPEKDVSEPIAGHDGKATTLLTPVRELAAKYRLVEADSLVPSHDAQTFAKNAGYPEGLQERAYDTSKEAQARVIQQAQNYDSRYTVNTNPDAVNGPPVVTPDGTVLGGNSRAMSTQRLYAEDGSEYKAALKEQAGTFGFTPEQVEGMQKPVLVRQVESPATADDARRLGSELNKSMTGAMGVAERSVSAGKNIKPETLRAVADMMHADDATLRETMSKHGAQLVRMLVADGAITDRERPQFVDAATGGLSEEGKTFVERALMGSVIDDPRLMDAAPKSVLSKLERSLGAITSFASRADEWNLLPPIREAVAELGAIQRSGSTVELRLGQTDMFGEARNPLVDAMIRTLDGKPNEVRKAFEDFARDSDANLPGQSRMFGEASAFDAFNHAFGAKLTEEEYHNGYADANDAATEAPDAAGRSFAPDDRSLSGGTDRDAASGSGGGAGGLGSGTETLRIGDTLYQMARDSGAGDRSTQPLRETPEGAHRKIESRAELLDELNKPDTYVRWQKGIPEVGRRSLNHGNMSAERGLSVNHPGDDGEYTAEYAFAGPRSWILRGETVGEGGDGEPLLDHKKFQVVGEIGPKLRSKLIAEKFLFDAEREIQRRQWDSPSKYPTWSSAVEAESKVRRYSPYERAQQLGLDVPSNPSEKVLPNLLSHLNRAEVEKENSKLLSPSNGEDVLHQVAEDGARGWFRVLPDGSYEIGKTKIGNLSTFVHEPAHAYLKILGDLAKREGASEVLKGDYRKALDFLGAKDGQPLTREQQEIWARANEQYLREGKAPSPGLKGTFQRFAIWLGSVYKKATDLGVHLTDDIRGVFDRLYAAESGVERAETEAGPKLFTTPEEAGWTPEQFARYAEDNHMSAEQARADLLGRLNEAAVRARSEAWRAEEQNVRTAVTAEVDQSPEYTAIRSLRRGSLDDGTELTMNRDALVQQFGEERVKELQKLHPGLYRVEGGIDPETAAEILGFRSAEEMMTALKDVPRRSELIEQGTRAYMTAKHGDIRYDGTLDDQARIALENDRRADSLHSELTALRKKLDDAQSEAQGRQQAMRDLSVAPIDAYREAAHQMIEAKAVGDVQPMRYLDASRKYSREAFDALRRGDTEAAAEAKHKELMNHFLFREATNAKEYIGRFESYAKRMQNKTVQSKLGLAGEDYRDQFNRILGRYGLGPATGPAERTLAEWAAAQYGAGKEPAIDAAVLDETRAIHYRNAPLSEVRAVHDALINVKKLAYLELEMEVNGRKIEFHKAVSSMAGRAYESLKSNPRPVFEENRTVGQVAGDLVNRGAALLARTEFTMKQLDGGVTGPWHDNLWHLAADAQGKEYELHEAVTRSVGDALANMPKEQRMKLLEKVTIEGVDEPLTRQRMIAIALNTGNAGNLDRLERTFIANNWDPHAIEPIKSSLTREEWQFIQGVWDSLKPLGKAQFDLEQRLTGLPPVMVRPTPLHLKLGDGTEMDVDGGYYPIVYDPRFSTRGAQQDASSTAQNLMESGYGRAVTSRGNMQARTGYGGPLQLDYEQVLTQHTAKVVKDISHREFMLAANKLLMDQQTRQAVRDTLGTKSEEQMMPWLRTIVNDKNGSAVQGLSDVSRAMAGLRTNIVKAALGFKFSTVLLQLTHASSIFLHTSPGSYAQAMIDFLAHPKAMSEEIRQLSPNEMRSRGENLDRDMRKVLQDGIGNKGIGDLWAKAGMMPVQFMDHILSFPLWSAVYRDALKASADLPEDEAKYQAMQKADGAVRMGLGSNAPKDLAPIMRNHDLTKLLTTMGGFHNLKWNQMADVVSGYRNGGNLRNLSYGLLMASIVPAVMGPLITGHGPKDDENAGEWAAKRALLFPAETMAILNIAVEAMENKGDVRFTPIAAMIERAAKASIHAAKDQEDKDWTGIGMDALQSAMEAFGVSGTDQAFKIARYFKQANEGKIEDPNAWDAVAGSPQPAHR